MVLDFRTLPGMFQFGSPYESGFTILPDDRILTQQSFPFKGFGYCIL